VIGTNFRRNGIRAVCTVALMSCAVRLSDGHAAGKGEPRTTQEPNSGVLLRELELQLGRDAYLFTPEVRASFLAFRKAQAVEALATQAVDLPDTLLSWIDETPMVASTVYGIRHGTPAQALVLLRSLELDLGREDLRANIPLVLATVMLHAAQVDLGNPEAFPHVRLQERPPLTVAIPECPLVKVDTHPTDRPFDINDHIINFMEEEEVLEDGKVIAVKPREKHIRACDIVASRALQIEFNAYMQRKIGDFKPLDCGDNELHWKYGGVSWRLPHKTEHSRAWKMFYEAYTAKGRLPKGRDPMPTPVEWLAYQIANAKTRGVTLPDVWPYAMYLMRNLQPLREAEYAWEEKSKGMRPMRYIEYVGKVAQDIPKLRLRRLTPFDYGYGSLAMMRKDGGVCGTHTATAMQAGAALGRCMVNCASPGHSFPASLAKNDTGYTAPNARTGVKWYFGIGEPEGTGEDRNKLLSLAAAMNWGCQGFVDSQLGWTLHLQLPEELRVAHGYALLKSALMQNPYNLSLAREARKAAKTPAELIMFWEEYQAQVLSAKDKWGCPREGGMIAEMWNAIAKALEEHAVPEDGVTRDRVYAAISKEGCSPTLRTKYELEVEGLDALLVSTANELAQHFSQYYRPGEQCKTMASRLQSTVDAVTDAKRRRAWLKSQGTVLADRGLCLTKAGKKYEVKRDESAILLAKLAGTSVDNEAWTKALLDLTTGGLEAHIDSRRTTPSCKDMAARLNAIIAVAEAEEIDLTSWAATWFKMMEGKQRYARHSWCAKDASSVVLDALVERYPDPRNGDEKLAELRQKLGALQRELNDLNRNTSRGQNQERINAINREIDELSDRIEASRKEAD